MTTPILTGQDIAEAAGAVRTLLDRTLESSGVTSNEYVVLRLLTQRSGENLHAFLVSQRQLNLTDNGATTLLEAVRGKGFTTADGDRVVLTDAGLAKYGQLTDVVSGVTRRLYGTFDPSDLATAHNVLAGVTGRAAEIAATL